MADSHGRPETIALALEALRRQGCERIFHLGDICDSMHAETADACVRLLQAHDVSALKGNNDHAVVVNHAGREDGPVSGATVHYLKQLPLRLDCGEAILCHSLPFVRKRGLSAMIGTLGDQEVAEIFKRWPDRILFRGHSHDPLWIRHQEGKVVRTPLAGRSVVELEDALPCIVSCGALTRGLCLVWDRTRRRLSGVRFFP